MEWLEPLKRMKAESGIKSGDLPDVAGVKKSTVEKIFAGKTPNPGINTMQKLVHAMGYTLDDLFPEDKKAPTVSVEAMRAARDLDALDSWGRAVVEDVIAGELARVTAETEEPAEEPANKIIPLFGAAFAAGVGDPDFGNPWEDYEVPADSKAEFAVRISGNSMEPYLPDGSIALAVKRGPRDGEVAALLLDGGLLVKQVCEDSHGNLHLFALNRARSDADVMIQPNSDRDIRCFGTILMQPVELP